MSTLLFSSLSCRPVRPWNLTFYSNVERLHSLMTCSFIIPVTKYTLQRCQSICSILSVLFGSRPGLKSFYWPEGRGDWNLNTFDSQWGVLPPVALIGWGLSDSDLVTRLGLSVCLLYILLFYSVVFVFPGKDPSSSSDCEDHRSRSPAQPSGKKVRDINTGC